LLNWPEQAGRAPDMPSLLLKLRQAAEDPPLSPTSSKTCWKRRGAGRIARTMAARDMAGFDAWRRDPAAPWWPSCSPTWATGRTRAPATAPCCRPSPNWMRPPPDLARRALADPAFCAAPHLAWLAPAETGALARMADPPMLAAWIARRGRGAGARLLARLLELAELPQRLRAEPDPTAANPGGPGLALGGKCRHGRRGNLPRPVGPCGAAGGGKVAEYRIVAPTEWNFHPAGPLAQALAGLGTGPGLEAAARLVSQSLDPCVAYGVELLEQ
jgi:hypothetical protein